MTSHERALVQLEQLHLYGPLAKIEIGFEANRAAVATARIGF